MRFRWFTALVLGAGLAVAARADDSAAAVTIVICGDSTVADYGTNKPGMNGWGQVIRAGFAPQVRVVNHSVNGRSTKTFISEGRLARAVAVKADFALIQFGHNDSHAKEKPEATDANTAFKENLRRFVDEFRAAGTEPVLITPMHRRKFDEQRRPTDELLPYALAMKAVAAEKKAALVDLHVSSGELLEKLGEPGSESLFYPGDRTHFSVEGARTMAGLVLEGLRREVPRLGTTIVRTDLVHASATH